MELFLSKSTMPIVRYVAILLGWLMNGIYEVLDRMSIPNIGVAIIIFTIIIYTLMLPIQIKTQKSSKLMSVIQPEMQKIQKKYEGKRDQASQMKMQEELTALYSKYGYSPSGTCLPLLIQMPLLFGLYQVILYIPGYVQKVGDIFSDLATKISSVNGYEEIIAAFVKDNKVRIAMGGDITLGKVIDFLYTLKPAQWLKFREIAEFSAFSSEMADTAVKSQKIQTFLSVNISDAPLDTIVSGFNSFRSGNGSAIIIVSMLIAVLIPFMAWFTQWLNMKLMPQSAASDDKNGGAMNQQMQTMNRIMPLFSAFICISLNMGVGIYWVMGGIIRCIQQVVINRSIGKIDTEQIVEEAKQKAAKKLEKESEKANHTTDGSITRNARINMKKIESGSTAATAEEEEEIREIIDAAPGSIMARANMVRKYDENNRKKK